MKILLVGNYVPDRQWSMLGYVDGLQRGLEALGLDVEVIRPQPRLLKGGDSRSGKGKYIAYLDKYVLFPRRLKKVSKEFDLAHVVDQGNAMYLRSCSCKTLLTVHDLMAIKAAQGMYEDWKIGASGQKLQKWIADSIPLANHFSCVSNHTSEDLAKLFQIPADRRTVIHNALFEDFRSRPAVISSEMFVHHVGGNQPYKNRVGVVKFAEKWLAMEKFSSWKLKLVGAPPDERLAATIAESPLQNRIEVIKDASDSKLAEIYQTSQALIFPSLEEGFGLPILEAQSAGCPVITTRATPMTEVGGESCIYLGDDVMSAVNELPESRSKWAELGYENLKRFSPKVMAMETVELYKRLVCK